MLMPVMDIRNVRVGMRHGCMVMRMHMWLLAVPREIMIMLVMGVVSMFMRMIHREVRMLMNMLLGQMQPDSSRHQCACQPESRSRRVAEH